MERKEVVRLSSDLLREALSSNGNEAAIHLTELSVQGRGLKYWDH